MSVTGLALPVLLQDHLIERLTEHCHTQIPEDDTARVTEVVRDSLQESPTRGFFVEVYHQQPRSPDVINKLWDDGWNKWVDERDPTFGMEVGGGEFWLRRYTVRVRTFTKGMTEEEARHGQGVLASRLTDCLRGKRGNPYPSLQDDYGERLIKLNSISAPVAPQGGNKMRIYEMVIRLEFLTHLQ